MSRITIVTAFFDIGRGDFIIPRCAPRSIQKYMDYFDFWARIQNEVVVYTSPEYKEQIFNIRKRYGRGEKTIIVEVENIFEMERGIFDKMLAVENNVDFKNFRFWDEEVSNRADYNYIMLMKYWCMADAVRRGLIKEVLLWMDFGYNHGGECFINPEEFNFELVGSVSEKIQIFCLSEKNPQYIHAGISLQYQIDTLCGSPIVMSSSVAHKLWEMVRNAMLSLISLDCIDDDQQLLLMAYKLHPELFEIRYSDWFMPIKEFYGGGHLTIRDKGKRALKKQLIKRIFRKIGILMSLADFSQTKRFLIRTNGIARKYYGK